MKDTVVFDLDGTLANCDHRTPLLHKDKPDWDGFYDSVYGDSLNEWCAKIMELFFAWGYEVVIVSARRISCEDNTLRWLAKHGVKYSQLKLLRCNGDYTPDTVLKKAWLDSYGKENILFVVDDRQKVVDMWRDNGIVCLQCYAWEEYKK